MPDLFETQTNLSKERHIYTVSEITQDIKLILENTFGEVWVEGEISGFSTYPSGHSYFTLKDDTAILPAVLFVRAARDIKFKIEDGLKVVCLGKISAYTAHASGGKYQIIVDKIEPKGIGALQLALEQLKQKLEKEGLFAAEHKRPIPYLPSRIGIVTSLSGAAIKDILKVLHRRFADIHVIINPTQVQGETAKEEIAQAIKEMNIFNNSLPSSERIEVMIVGRGGGSMEDLWAFNEEIVARAIYNSKIPIISAVGHERDWTIADLVADLRAPTPSVAAEIAIPEKEELRERLEDLSGGLKRALTDAVENFNQEQDGLIHRLSLNMGHIWQINQNQLAAAVKKLSLLNPATLIPQYKTKILDFARQIYVRMDHLLELKHSDFSGLIAKLSSLNPLNILARGYSVTFKMPAEEIIKDSCSLKKGDYIKTRVHKGEILSKVTEVN